MSKFKKWIESKIESTDHLWYLWIGIMVGIEVLNISIVRKYLSFGIDIFISMLILAIAIYYSSVLYKYTYHKYRSYHQTNYSQIFIQLEGIKSDIKMGLDKTKEELEIKYNDLSLKVEDARVQLNKVIESNFESNTESIENNTRFILENAEALSTKTNMAIANTNDSMNRAFENTSSMVTLKTEELVQITNEKFDRSEQLIIHKFSEHENNSQNNLHILQNKISEAIIKDIEGITRIQESITEINEKTNLVLNQSFNEIKTIYDQQHSNFCSNLNELFNNLDIELKDVSEEFIRTANKNKEDVIQEATRESIDKYNKMAEVINRILNQSNENYKGIIEQINLTENSVCENSNRQTIEVVESLLKIEDLMKGQYFESEEQIKEVRDEIIGNTNFAISSNFTSLSGQLKETTDTINEQINNEKYELMEGVRENKNELVEKLENVLTKSINKLEEERQAITYKMDTNVTNLAEKISNRANITDTTINNNNEILSAKIDELSQGVNCQLNNDRIELIENTNKAMESLSELLNVKYNNMIDRVNESNNLIIENIGEAKKTVGNHILTKQDELFSKIDVLNKESIKELGELLENNNRGVEFGIKELEDKIHDSTSNLTKVMGEEISVVNSKQSDIAMLVNNLINNANESQSFIKQEFIQCQYQIEALANDVTEEITKSLNEINQSQINEREDVNKFMDNRYNQLKQQISRLAELIGNKTNMVEKNLMNLISIANEIEKNKAKNEDNFTNILNTVIEKDREVLLNTNTISIIQEETSKKMDNLSVQISSLNYLLEVLNTVSDKSASKEKGSIDLKKEPNRKEKIHDKENGITVFNEFKNDILQYSEMHKLGKKIFSATYDSKGGILLSKNYDNQGKVIMEISYFPNGQIKQRKEKVLENRKMVTKITDFDVNGRKLS